MAICADRRLLTVLAGHLGVLSPDELSRVVSEAAASQQRQQRDSGEVIKTIYVVFNMLCLICYLLSIDRNLYIIFLITG